MQSLSGCLLMKAESDRAHNDNSVNSAGRCVIGISPADNRMSELDYVRANGARL